MKPNHRNLLEIHGAVLLFGMAGLFGKLIALPALLIVLGRVAFAALFLGLFFLFSRRGITLKQGRDYAGLVMLGIILAFHWWAFFHAIQVSTVAIGLLTFSTFPIFVTFLEPLYLELRRAADIENREKSPRVFKRFFLALKKTRIKPSDLFLALITFAGVVLVIPRFSLNDNMMQGALWGTASGFSFALLAILNKRYVETYSSLVIAFYQDLAAAAVLLPFVFLTEFSLAVNDILLLVLLGVVFTAGAHSLFIQGLTGVRAQTASIIACLEPVYGIIAAVFLLGEVPGLRVILGGVVILGTSFYATLHSS